MAQEGEDTEEREPDLAGGGGGSGADRELEADTIQHHRTLATTTQDITVREDRSVMDMEDDELNGTRDLGMKLALDGRTIRKTHATENRTGQRGSLRASRR